MSAGVIVAAAMFAAPATLPARAHADTVGDSFLAALNNAGVGYGDPANTVALGQSVCPMLVQPGGTFATVASSMAGNNGIAPSLAGLFTSIAISMYCPSMVSSLAGGDWLNAAAIPGVPGIPGMAGIPGIPGT
ncbi:MAG TPA: DUF732 domain-containing protein [Mycobacterium sp.]|nr:DUF732 domain-containing protein [Mycobacterium sp.]HZA09037.1 DUF732 domain-containing protein [Mycobacterium sp.]